MSSEHNNVWLSAEDLAEYGKRAGLPGTPRGCTKKAQREQWPSRQVQGKGGKGGIKTLYQPPVALLAAINTVGKPSQAAPAKIKPTPVQAPHRVGQPAPPSHLPSAQEAATPALDLHTLQTVIAMLEEELERKRAHLDPARKAEVISLLYDEAAAEREEDARRSKVLRLLRLVA